MKWSESVLAGLLVGTSTVASGCTEETTFAISVESAATSWEPAAIATTLLCGNCAGAGCAGEFMTEAGRLMTSMVGMPLALPCIPPEAFEEDNACKRKRASSVCAILFAARASPLVVPSTSIDKAGLLL